MSNYQPAYIQTFHRGLLRRKVQTANRMLKSCALCPRRCRTDRLAGRVGLCRTRGKARVADYHPHFGEEACLVGTHGSGTIFFSYCNLRCLFCQNFEISHEGYGSEVTHDQLADIMIRLQESGCHNINLVTPSHVVPQILSALEIAIDQGLTIPLVYNTSGYDSVATLKLLDGVVDIYMPDFKFWDPDTAEKICAARDYPEVARRALREMHRQVGDLAVDDAGIAEKGLLIRHLVLPHGLAGTREVMRYIAGRISKNSYVNIMAQYRPCGRAFELEDLSTVITRKEYENAVAAAVEEGIHRLDMPKGSFPV